MVLISIILTSDIHYHYDDSRKEVTIGDNKHPDTVQKILRECESSDISTIIIPGDFTDHAFDNKKFCCCIVNGEHDEVGTFFEEFYQPLKEKVPNILACVGNHSSYVVWPYTHKPEHDFIKETFGGLYYSQIIDGIRYYCCGLYPTLEVSQWLSDGLISSDEDTPSIIFFHYNLEGDYSDWWSQAEKDEFLRVITPHKSKILCIMCGHYHITSNKKWNDVNVVMAAARDIGFCQYNTDSKEFLISFF